MGYPQKNASCAVVRASNAHDTAENISASAADYGSLYVLRPIKVTGFYFAVTTIVASSTLDAVVALKRRTLLGSSGTESNLAVMTIPNGTAVGKVLYKFIEPVICYPGDELLYDHITQNTDAGTATGAGFYGLDFEDVAESAANCTDWVASS
jgi:hypothetical protein